MELLNYCFDARYADIMSSRSGLYPREAFHRLASPQTSFGVRSSCIHSSPTDDFSYKRGVQFNLEWMFSKLDSGFQSLVGFRILSTGFLIPKPRFPDSTSKKFLDSGIRIPLHGARDSYFGWSKERPRKMASSKCLQIILRQSNFGGLEKCLKKQIKKKNNNKNKNELH